MLEVVDGDSEDLGGVLLVLGVSVGGGLLAVDIGGVVVLVDSVLVGVGCGAAGGRPMSASSSSTIALALFFAAGFLGETFFLKSSGFAVRTSGLAEITVSFAGIGNSSSGIAVTTGCCCCCCDLDVPSSGLVFGSVLAAFLGDFLVSSSELGAARFRELFVGVSTVAGSFFLPFAGDLGSSVGGTSAGLSDFNSAGGVAEVGVSAESDFFSKRNVNSKMLLLIILPLLAFGAGRSTLLPNFAVNTAIPISPRSRN